MHLYLFFTQVHYVSPCGVTNQSFRLMALIKARATPWGCNRVGWNEMQPYA